MVFELNLVIEESDMLDRVWSCRGNEVKWRQIIILLLLRLDIFLLGGGESCGGVDQLQVQFTFLVLLGCSRVDVGLRLFSIGLGVL